MKRQGASSTRTGVLAAVALRRAVAAPVLVVAVAAPGWVSGCRPGPAMADADQTSLRGTATATTARWMPMLTATAEWREVSSNRLQTSAQPLLRYRDPERPTLFAFWATYCPPCLAELPALKTVHESGRVAVVSVSLDSDRPALAAAALKHHGVEHRSVVLTDVGLSTVGSRLPRGIPFTLLVDRNGQVVRYRSGPVDLDVLATMLGAVGDSALPRAR